MHGIARLIGAGLACAAAVTAAPEGETDRAAGVAARLQEACDGGDAGSCVGLGKLARLGMGIPMNPVLSARLFARACDRGAMAGCGQLGDQYVLGLGTPKKPEKGVALLQRACDGDDAWSCETLGVLHEEGEVVAADPERAAALRSKACTLDAKRCPRTPADPWKDAPGDSARDIASAHERECEEGNAQSCAYLGTMLLRGKGDVAADPPRALRLLERACDGRIAAACTALGKAHYFGVGVARDRSLGADGFDKACAARHPEGCALLAACLLNGEGRPQDAARAVALLERTCPAEPLACSFLGSALERGLGAARDLARAAELHRRSCEAGVAKGCLDLGSLHASGRGVPRDRAQAAAWFQKACATGNQVVCKSAQEAQRKMPAE